MGQKPKIVLGKLTFLKNESFVKAEYDYSSMAVGKFADEKEYVNKKKSEYNSKEAGRGDQWEKSWINDRKNRFEPKFEELLNKYLDNKLVISSQAMEYNFIMVVKTTFTEPGFNVYVTRKPAMINTEITFYKKDDIKTPVAKMILNNCPGNSFGGNDYDTGERISEAYAKCGKELGKFIFKNIGK